MTDYKLVPVEPTEAMLTAARVIHEGDRCHPVFLHRDTYKAMLAAAPAVQGEPFAWATFDGEGSYDLRLYENNEDYRERYLAANTAPMYQRWVFPLYAAPQPAEQPAPDVAELVEALEIAKLRARCEELCDMLEAFVEDYGDVSFISVEEKEDTLEVREARRLIAAHRKGGES